MNMDNVNYVYSQADKLEKIAFFVKDNYCHDDLAIVNGDFEHGELKGIAMTLNKLKELL